MKIAASIVFGITYLLWLLTSYAALGQRYEAIDTLRSKAVYQLTYLPDSTQNKVTKQEYMTLLIGRNLSVFQSNSEYLKDSIMIAREVWKLDPMAALSIVKSTPKSSFTYAIRKNVGDGELIVEASVLKDMIAYEELLVADWVLFADTASHAGYLCQKATTTFGGRDYVAWFTTELPIPDGPYKFGGLPGLIVMLHDLSEHYTFALVEFSTAKKQQAIYLPAGKRTMVARAKFDALRKQADDSFYQMVQQMGANLTFTVGGVEQTAQEMDRMRAKKTIQNPIELTVK
jgi:GLPGLI family protein